jgi:ATP-dependent DNA helicase RecQ
LSDHSLEVGQKILSCIKRLNEMFGADYISKVLTGSRDQRILEWKHDKVSTYGMLSEFNKRQVRDWIEQLVGQGYIAKDPEFGAMTITSKGWLIIRGEDTPKLLKPAVKQATTRDRSSKGVDARSWEGVDRDLFGKLRMLRLDIATEKNVPAFIIFGDASLRDMARMKPTTVAAFKEVYGVGDQKSKEYAARFTQLIAGFVKG